MVTGQPFADKAAVKTAFDAAVLAAQEEMCIRDSLGERLDQRASLEELHVHLVTRAIIDERLDLQPSRLLELNVHSPDFAPLDLNALHYPALLGISAVCTLSLIHILSDSITRSPARCDCT